MIFSFEKPYFLKKETFSSVQEIFYWTYFIGHNYISLIQVTFFLSAHFGKIRNSSD